MTSMLNINLRFANNNDLVKIVSMLADDELGSKREQFGVPLPDQYTQAFNIIKRDENQELTVAEMDDEVVGTFHLTFVQYLTYCGGIRAQIEAVRVSADWRGKGLGKVMIEYAIEQARIRGAHMIQLTTDKQRPEAIKFYETLGFKASHEGMKLHFS